MEAQSRKEAKMAKEKKNNEEAKEEEKEQNQEEELKKLNSEIEEWKNKYYTAYADMQNLRKALEKDHSEALKYRASGFVEELLPALDSFRFALIAEPQSQEAKNYKTGFDYIYKSILGALEKEGVKEVTPKLEDPFDVKFMMAMDTIAEDDKEPQKVTKVYASAYYLKDRLIRPARVQVRIKENKKEETKPEPAAKETAKA